MPYKKHQIFISKGYAVKENTVELPDSAQWRVTHHLGNTEEGGHFSPDLKGPIMMCLNDDEGQFWPIMSFLTDEEAGALAADLLAAIKDNIVKEAQE